MIIEDVRCKYYTKDANSIEDENSSYLILCSCLQVDAHISTLLLYQIVARFVK